MVESMKYLSIGEDAILELNRTHEPEAVKR